MNGLIKAVILAAPFAALGAILIPGYLRRSELTSEFEPALERFGSMKFEGDGKNGQLKWPEKLSAIDRDKLPAIAPGVLMMEPERKVYIRARKTEVRPAKIFEGFFDLDASLRAKTPADVRTLVFARRESRSGVYSARKGVAMKQVLSQTVVIVKIFDVESRTHLGSWTLYGERPPTMFRSDETPKIAPPPTAAEFLAALPRR